MKNKTLDKLYKGLAEEITAFAINGRIPSGSKRQIHLCGMFFTLECYDDGERILILRLKRYSKAWGKGIYEFLGRVLNKVVRDSQYLTWRMWKYEGVMIEFDLIKPTLPIDTQRNN